MIDSLAICFDGLREFDSELKNGVRINSRIDDCNFELTSVSFNPVFLLSFFLSLFFFFLHYTRYVASRKGLNAIADRPPLRNSLTFITRREG